MITDGGGWIVIQRNKKDSVVSFNCNWNDYEKGFGDLNTEFWYGTKYDAFTALLNAKRSVGDEN